MKFIEGSSSFWSIQEMSREKSYTSHRACSGFLSRLWVFLPLCGSSIKGNRLFFFSKILHPKLALVFCFFLGETVSYFVILKFLRDLGPMKSSSNFPPGDWKVRILLILLSSLSFVFIDPKAFWPFYWEFLCLNIYSSLLFSLL